MSLPTLVFLGPAAVCALSWLGAGMLLPRRLLSGSLLLDTLTRFAAGAATLSVLILVLGRLGAFRPAALVPLTGVCAAAGLVAAVGIVRRAPRPPRLRGAPLALAALVAAALVLDLLGATAPPTSADALVYHVELPHRWLGLGRIDDPYWNYAAFYPLGVEMLFAQGLALAGASAASALHGILTVLAALAVYGLARELGGGRTLAGLAGSALFVLQGAVTWDATSTFIDMGLTFFTALAAWHVVRYAHGGGRPSAVLAGIACGGAAAAKYVGPLAAVFVVLPLAVLALARRRPGDLAAAVGATLAWGGAWYLKNAIVTGNPFYPLLFGGHGWTAYAERELKQSATAVFPGTHGSNPLRVLILPVDLLVHGDRFDRGQYVGTAIFLFALAALVLLRRNGVALGAFAAAAAYTLVWWYVQPQARYLMPALAVLAALGGVAAAELLDRGGPGRLAALVVLAAAAVAWAVPSAALERQLLPVAFGAETRAAHVQRLLGTWDLFHEVARRVGRDTLVGSAGYRFIFWYPGRMIELGRPEFAPDLTRSQYARRLREEGVDYILLQGGLGQLAPIRSCVQYVAAFHGRYVTSRTRGTGYPLVLRLTRGRASKRGTSPSRAAARGCDS